MKAIFALLATSVSLLLAAQNPIFFGQNKPPAAPTIPTSSLKLWISADCITLTAGVCSTPANNSTISTWSDRSGNVNDASVNTGTCTFHTSQINTQPAVTFASCGLTLTSGIAQTPGGCTSPNDCYYIVFSVLKNTATGVKGAMTSCTSTDLGCFKFWTGTTKQTGTDVADSAQILAGTASQDTSWHQQNVKADYFPNGGCNTFFTMALRLDRASDGSLSNNVCAGFTHSIGHIGYDSHNTNEFFGGQLAEQIIYNNNLGSTDFTSVETYLHGKYGL
jgi:hypothetical protein